MDSLPQAYAAMGSYTQFIVYNTSTKCPIDIITHRATDGQNPENWMGFDNALCISKTIPGSGVGFVFTSEDPFFFIDIDGCIDEKGNKSDIAQQLLDVFNGAAMEVSQSGRGLHIFGCGNAPKHTNKNSQYHIEFYTEKRFVALTGYSARGDSSQNFTPQLQWLVDSYFTSPTESDTAATWTKEPIATWSGDLDDDKLLQRMLNSISGAGVFSGKASFRDLWVRDVDKLSATYPSAASSESPFDQSQADAALTAHLAFWTGNNCERILRFLLRSGLKRDKWERKEYLEQTILTVCSRTTQHYSNNHTQKQTNKENTDCQTNVITGNLATGSMFLNGEQQRTYFAGCVYVQDEHRVLIPGGYLISPERFRATYGGRCFPMDMGNEKTTKNAWEAFSESQLFQKPQVRSTHFRPELSPGSITEINGELFVNTYSPALTPRVKGDPAPFINHINKLFHVEHDRLIIISYLAALIQHKGVKFQWCPVIQGVEGNGKTLLTRCVAYAIGLKYVHFPKPAEMSNRFNDWLYGRVFIGIEDIYSSDYKNELIEIIKPMITNSWQEIEAKNGAKVTREICANFLINTNHKDGLRKTENDRRFAVFFTSQQSIADLARDGMDSDYFSKLYNWLSNETGYAITAEYLESFKIPDDLNPAIGCQRAPSTSSITEALEHGRNAIQDEIMEAIESGRFGFKNGWISSTWLNAFLESISASRRIPMRNRRALMQSLGYDWHPGLNSGRLNNPLKGDATKARLYIHNTNTDINLKYECDIIKAYEEAQNT